MLDLETLLAPLPPPPSDAPPALRSDIVDELLDHLQCAFRREVLKDGDEAAAEKRVLDRFGDPKQLARRLWWQAMWSRVMGKKILSGLQWLLTTAAVVMAGGVLWQQSLLLDEINAQYVAEANWRGSLQATLNDLRSRMPHPGGTTLLPATSNPMGSTGTVIWPDEMSDKIGSGVSGGGGSAGGLMSAPSMSMPSTGDALPGGMMASGGGGGPMPPQPKPTLTVQLVQDTEDGAPVTEVKSIQLSSVGNVFPARPEQLPPGGAGGGAGGSGMGGLMGAPGSSSPISSANGRFYFEGGLQPDRYELHIELADGQRGVQHVLIRDDTPRALTVICPSPRKKAPVLISVPPLPEDLRTALQVSCIIDEESLRLGDVEWGLKSQSRYSVIFDAHTGEASQIQSSNSHLVFSAADQQDRSIFLHAGPAKVRLELRPDPIATFRPGRGRARDGKLDFMRASEQQLIVKPGDNRWSLEIPEDKLANAREHFNLTPPEPGTGDLESLPAPTKTAAPVDEAASVPNPKPANTSEKPPAAAQPLGDKARLIVKLTSETKEGPAPEGAVVSLLEQGSARTFPLHDESGEFVTKPIPAGRYALKINLPGGRELSEKLPLLRPGQERREEIICPPQAPKTTVLITAPAVPEDLREIKDVLKKPRAVGGIGGGALPGGGLARGGINPGAGGLAAGRAGRDARPGAGTADVYLLVTLAGGGGEFEGRDWSLFTPAGEMVAFDPKTGLLQSFQKLQFKDEPAEDRALILHSGEYRAALVSLYGVIVGERRLLAHWPPYPNRTGSLTEEELKLIRSQQQQFTAEPGENKWEIKLPDEFWAEARKTLAELEAKAVEAEPVPDKKEDGAATQPLGDKCRLIVKLTSETKDGPAPEGIRAGLFRMRAQNERKQFLNPVVEVVDSRLDKAGGTLMADRLTPGPYQLTVHFPDGRSLKYEFEELKPGQERTEHVICPPPVKQVAVKINAPPVPEDFRTQRLKLWATLRSLPKVVDGREWSIRTKQHLDLTFDYRTGKLLSESRGVEHVALENSEIVLPDGTYEISLLWVGDRIENEKTRVQFKVAEWPKGVNDETARYTTQPDENKWYIKVPDEFWDEAREKLAELEAKATGGEPATKSPVDADPVQPAEPKEEPAGEPAEPGADRAKGNLNAAAPTGGRLHITVMQNGKPLGNANCIVTHKEENRIRTHDKGHTRRDGTVEFVDLPQVPLEISVGQELGYYVKRTVDLSQVASQTLEFDVPPRPKWFFAIPSADLPQDLFDAGVRVAFDLASESLEVEGEVWNVSRGDFLPKLNGALAIGPKGYAGMLTVGERMTWKVANRENPITVERVMEALNEVDVSQKQLSAVPHRLTSIKLMRLVEGTVAETVRNSQKDPANWWEVLATKKIDEDSAQRFDPADPYWKVKVPEDVVAAARKYLAESESATATEAPPKNDPPADAAAAAQP